MIRVSRECPFILGQFAKEREAADAIRGDTAPVDFDGAPDKVGEVVPIEVVAASNFFIKRSGSKRSRACHSFMTTRRRMSG